MAFRESEITIQSKLGKTNNDISYRAKSRVNNTKVIILCAGDGTRWNNYLGVPKQLIPINKEPLLNRTVRLLCDSGYDDIAIIAHDNRLNLDGCDFITPPRSRWTVETLLSTHSLWEERTLVLLGDVFYTKQALATIVSPRRSVQVYGRFGASLFTFTQYGELFAISFDENNHHKIKKHLMKACSHALSGGRGKLWEFYRSLAGFPLNEHKREEKIFTSIHDLTDDIDSPKEYHKIIERYSYAASKNPLKQILVYCWVNAIIPFLYIKKFLRPIKNYTLQLITK